MEPLHRLGPIATDDRVIRFHPQRIRSHPFSRVSATLSNTPTAGQSGPKCWAWEALGRNDLPRPGVWWPVEGVSYPSTTCFVATIGPWRSVRAFLMRPTGPRFGSCCPDPPRYVVWRRIGMPNRLIDQLETRFSTTNEPTHPPFDNEMKGSSCTITHITTSQAGTRCPTTATTSSPSPLMTPRVSAVSHRTPLRATRMCNELRAVNWSTG